MRLFDGTIIPSTETVASYSDNTIVQDARFNNYALRLGRVIAAYYPDDKKNQNKHKVEYDVVCHQANGKGAVASVTYRCTLTTLFGAAGDYVNYTLRADPDSFDSSKNIISNGAIVLVLCANGHSHNAYIVGGSTHRSRPADSKEDGHHFDFEFNGIAANIDKLGQFTVTQKGPTDLSGKPDTSSVGSNSTQFKLDQNGSVLFNVNSQSVEINKSDKTTTINADKSLNTNSNGTTNINSTSNVNIKSSGVLVGTATDAWIKGTTYRANEIALHASLQASLAALDAAAAAAGASLAAAGALHVIPVAGPIIASPGVIAAGTAITSMAPIIAAMQAAIAAFEAQAALYLSLKNFTD